MEPNPVGRRRAWQRRLPRLQLGAEPIEEQLNRLRRANLALTILSGAIALVFVALFSLFGSSAIGLAIGALFFGAIVTPAWRSFHRTRLEVARDLDEFPEVMGTDAAAPAAHP